MDIISLEQSDRLYWLGRYAERVYTTIGLFFRAYDTMLDKFDMEYKDFCRRLNIPNIYESPADFCTRYTCDVSDVNSIAANLQRAYDNAIVLREEIGSEALSYVQLAIYDLQKAALSDAPLIEFMKVKDNLMAFWGICDDNIANAVARNLIKLGKRHERIDLYVRLHEEPARIRREMLRLEVYLRRAGVRYNQQAAMEFSALIAAERIDYAQAITACEALLTL